MSICANGETLNKKLFDGTQFIEFSREISSFDGEPSFVGVSYSLSHSTQLGGFRYLQTGAAGQFEIKEILKKEYLRREYDPHSFKYKEGVTMDPAMFRWYSADMTQAEFFRFTPRTVFLYVGTVFALFYIYTRLMFVPMDKSNEACLDGKILWWDRQQGRTLQTGGSGLFAPTIGIDF